MLFLSLLLACNDCSYYEACDGDTLLVCGDGVDQQFGRTENPTECVEPNPVCVDVGEKNAACAASAGTCEGTGSSCDGDILTRCTPFESALGLLGEGSDVSLETSTDCAEGGQTCQVDDTTGDASCG